MYVQLMLKDSPQLSGRTINYGVVVSAFPSAELQSVVYNWKGNSI